MRAKGPGSREWMLPRRQVQDTTGKMPRAQPHGTDPGRRGAPARCPPAPSFVLPGPTFNRTGGQRRALLRALCIALRRRHAGRHGIEPLAIRSVAVGPRERLARPARRPRGAAASPRKSVSMGRPGHRPAECRGRQDRIGRRHVRDYLRLGVTVTTMAGPVAYQVLSPDAIRITRGLVVVLTPPISGRVVTCLGLHGEPFLAAAQYARWPAAAMPGKDPRRRRGLAVPRLDARASVSPIAAAWRCASRLRAP